MKYKITYSCISNIGNCRKNNEDNYYCVSKLLSITNNGTHIPIVGSVDVKENPVFAVFDGMGGEEKGEVAAYLAAKTVSEAIFKKENMRQSLIQICKAMNKKICEYASKHRVSAMGSTLAMVVFLSKEIYICNIGDSKIFYYSDGNLKQLSQDHLSLAPFGVKAPLFQNLGIPEDEMIIEPYIARGTYNNNDRILICSDGLTDMLTKEDIESILSQDSVNEANEQLVKMALEKGGNDNITSILCQINKTGINFLRKLQLRKEDER